MNHFDLLEKRHHVRKYSEKIPPRYVVEHALWQAWKTTPSKNNAMPYKVIVLGPECKKEKQILYDLSKENDKNDIHNTCSLAPYVLIFTNRLATPNKAVKRSII